MPDELNQLRGMGWLAGSKNHKKKIKANKIWGWNGKKNCTIDNRLWYVDKEENYYYFHGLHVKCIMGHIFH